MMRSRASKARSVVVLMTPAARTTEAAVARSSTPKPVATSPGSMPSAFLAPTPLGSGDGLDDLVGDVVVGVDGLNVVEILQRFDESKHGRRFFAFDTNGGLGDER